MNGMVKNKYRKKTSAQKLLCMRQRTVKKWLTGTGCMMLMIFTFSCKNLDPLYIVTGENADITEKMTADLFSRDLEKASGKKVQIISADSDIPDKATVFIVGTEVSNSLISDLVKKKAIVLSENFPGERGGIWATAAVNNVKKAVVLAGSDVQGMQYAVFDYSQEILGTDPLAWWTGTNPVPGKVFDPFNFGNRVIAPPVIPLLCYFENDVDELANLKEPLLEYDWDTYTQMINSLVRLKYNAIHLFDMLGRPEFFLREEYRKIRPGYDVRLSYIDSLITYAQNMGMKVQIDLSLGYKFRPMAQDKADCWQKNKEAWLSAWKYYFEETPIGKADIFSLRPRNQVWDWEYVSSCGEDKTEVFNEVYAELGKLIDSYKPGAIKIVTCYSDAMEMFNGDFTPPSDWIIAWSDNGWGGFNILPDSTKGYRFGAYMHAGYWKNHTVHDPCPELLDSVMKMMYHQVDAKHYYEVNGQQFRPFLVNIEAFSRIAENPDSFNGDTFYLEWARRYFGNDAAVHAVNSMKKLHAAQFDRVGYVEHLWEIREAVAYLSESEIIRPGKPPVPWDYLPVENNYDHVKQRIKILQESLQEANKGLPYIPEGETFYHDYILLPVQIYLDLLTFEDLLHDAAKLKREFELTGDRQPLKEALHVTDQAMEALDLVYQRKLEGDKNPRWQGWYDPAKRRPNNGFPTHQMITDIRKRLNSL